MIFFSKAGLKPCLRLLYIQGIVNSQKVSGKCSLDILYGPDHPKLAILWEFRDEVLSQTPEGKEIIDIYYRWGPVLVEAMQQDENFKRQVQIALLFYSYPSVMVFILLADLAHATIHN